MPRTIQGDFNTAASALIDALGGTGALARTLGVSPAAVSNYRKLGIALKQYRTISLLCARNGIDMQDAAFAQDSVNANASPLPGRTAASPNSTDRLVRLRQRIHAGFDFAQAGERVIPNTIQPADPYLDLLGPDMRRKMWLVRNDSGDKSDLCLLPDYTIATARQYLRAQDTTPKPARYWYDGGRFRRDGDDPRNRQDEEIGFESFAHPDPLDDELTLLDNMRHLLQLAGVRDYQLRLNDVSLLTSLMNALNLDDDWQLELRRALQTQRLEEFWENQELSAQKWYRQATEQGYKEIQPGLSLGIVSFRYHQRFGTGMPQNVAEAPESVRKAAKQGDAKAQFNLGVMHFNGEGVPQDNKKAAKWWRKAAEQEDADAQFNLGVMYAEGKGVPQDHKEAAKCWRKAAQQGLEEAQFNLGMMHFNGAGVPQDRKEAAKWWQKAAEQGDAKAQFNLGVMYDNGKGVPQDHKEAAQWWRKAAQQGDAKAQFNLGVMYDNGQGVPQDHKEAAQWWRKAAEQGHAKAQANLGNMYAEGKGVPQDDAEAKNWFRKAAKDRLRHYLALHGDGTQTKTALQSFANTIDNEAFHKAIAHFCTRLERLVAIGYAPEQIRFAPQIGYELEYYSGLVFTITRPDSQIILASGGRYDRLLQRLGANTPIPACGGTLRLRALLQGGG